MDELDYLVALTQMKGIGSIRAKQLIDYFGSAKAVFEADANTLMLTHAGEVLLPQIDNPKVLANAHNERLWAESKHIRLIAMQDDDYPSRLKDVPDAPALLYYLGNASLNASHAVSIVGTRSATQYGCDRVRELVRDLCQALPDTLIISGLAMGIDVAAHNAALEMHVPTVGVLAHGLDTIYPIQHRNVAKAMVQQHGGLITEYPTRTEPVRGNFLARNRIIAALSDVVVVAESKERGGALVTARIANSYSREVTAFPGRITDEKSKGCNALIRNNQACLITDAADLMKQMQWEPGTLPFMRDNSEPEIPNLSPIGHQVVNLIHDRGALKAEQISEILGIERFLLSDELLQMELDGIIHTLPGDLIETAR